jgi:hypothetical protein
MIGRRPFNAAPGPLKLRRTVMVHAACAVSDIGPDAWFPISRDPAAARREAADALAICGTCLVRRHCVRLSLSHWPTGQHGVWGGTLPSEREALHDLLAALPRPERATS